MKNKHFKQILSLVLSLLLVVGTLPASALAAEDSFEGKPKTLAWEGFDEFSSEVSKLLGETMEDNYISAVTLEVGSAEMMVDGEEQSVVEGRNVTPVTKDDVMMLPVRALADCEDAAVTYDSETKTATVQTEDGEIAFTRGEAQASVSDAETEETAYSPLSSTPELIDGTMYIPLDAMASFFGYRTEVVGEKVLLTKPYQTKRLIVKSAEDELETYGAVREISGFHDLHVLQYETEEEAKEAHQKLMLADEVEYVEPDAVISTAEVHKSWGTDYIGADTYNAYLQENTSLDEVVLAVVDTGVDSEHEFLKDRIIPVNKNFVDSKPDSNDKNGHGTHVAGIVTDATLSNVKILPVKVLNSGGSGTSLSVYNGAMFAIEQNCDVINMSLGGYGKSALDEEAVQAAVAENISVVVAAGNDSIDAGMETPACVKEAITVGAITSRGYRASYSNYGAVVDIWAPGSAVLSSVPGNKYEEKSGTSMAAPLAAAATAMLKTWDKELSPRQIESILQKNGMEKHVKNSSGTTKVLSVASLESVTQEDIKEVVATPTLSLSGGYYQESQTLSITCETPGAVIRYTTDGTIPTPENGTVYAGPLTLANSTWLNVKAFKEDCIDSYRVETSYYISDYPESFHHVAYNYYNTWKYVCPDQNARFLKITFDADTYIPFPPPRENGKNFDRDYYDARLRKYGLYLYDGNGQPVNNEYADIDRNYFVYDELKNKSVIVAGNSFSIFLNCPFTSSDYGFRIKSVEPLYEERLSAPQFVTPCGNDYRPRVEFAKMMIMAASNIHYAEKKSITLSSPEGGEIYYTLDGSRPTRASLKYTGPITLDEPKKIRAKAFKDGYVESETVSETYYSSKYPESLHYAKRDYYFDNGWVWQAPSNVKYMAITFDEKTCLGENGSSYTLNEFEIYNSIYDISRQIPTKFYGTELAGRTIYIKGNFFKLFCGGHLPEGTECPYGFKITNIQYFYNEDDIVPIESIEISGPDSIFAGDQAQMTAAVTPSNANTGFFWRMQRSLSPDSIYASVDENGVVTGKKEGKTKLIATSNFINSILWPDGSTPNWPDYYYNGDEKEITICDPAPTGTIRYSTESPTNQSVIATFIPAYNSVKVTNNGGSTTYTFDKNGQFTFQLAGATGKTGSVTAKVDWIDKTAPTAELLCTPETSTNGDVVVTMTPSEEVTVTLPADGSTRIIAKENGTARFEFVDRAGNTGFAEKEISWIDKGEISASVSYQDLENGEVKALLETTKPVTVLNNGGSSEYTFTQNGSFTFEYTYDGGKTGSATAVVHWIENPVIYIYTPEDLVALSQQTNRGDLAENTVIYLEADLDMSGVSWTPIGTSRIPFLATFDGKGHTISHLQIGEADGFSGLFGCVGEDGIVNNLVLEDVFAVGTVVGAVAGKNDGEIENCVVTGDLRGTGDTGGIVGQNTWLVIDCHVRGSLAQEDTGSVGGIAGSSNKTGTILYCSMSGTITAELGTDPADDTYCGLGGIAGSCVDDTLIINCCTQGVISCRKEKLSLGGIAGTLMGNASLSNCYSIMELQNGGTQPGYGSGGIVGTVNTDDGSGWWHCIALNEKITASHDVGRVAGKGLTSVASKTGNIGYAFSGMLMGPEGSETAVEDAPISPVEHSDGEGITKEAINKKAFWENLDFTFGDSGKNYVWFWEDSKMPYFREEMAFDWPQWLALDPASLTKAPKAKAGLEYTGESQELIEPGEAESGTLLYSLSEDGEYSEDIPAGTNAGPYTVWYKVTGDDSHADLAPVSLTAGIAKASQPKNIPEDISVPAGTALSSLFLPDGWSWKDPGQTLSTGANQVTVVYADTENYEQTEFTITVNVEEPKHVHTMVKTEAKAATCTAEGNLEYWTCSDCKGVFADAEGTVSTTIAARVTAKLPHTPGEWEVVTPATTEQEGLQVKKCTVCQAELERETIPKLTPTQPDPPSPPSPPTPPADDPEPPAIDPEPAGWQNPFVDVKQRDWFYTSVEYVCENGLFYGISETTFGPRLDMTRGMLATALYRLAKKPETTANSIFSDVMSGMYYTEAIVWATENKIVAGYDNGKFGPKDPITREQLAAILWRYAGSPESTGKLDSFTDGNKATDYAVPALQWAVERKIVSGRGNGILDPKGKATRAEVAAMLMRYCEKAE